MKSEKKKKVEEGGERRGRGWVVERERDSSERTEMKRIRMEEKTIAMEGEKGNGEVKTEKRRRKKKAGEREQRVHKRRQGVSFPVEPHGANGQLVTFRDEFRGPYSFQGAARW